MTGKGLTNSEIQRLYGAAIIIFPPSVVNSGIREQALLARYRGNVLALPFSHKSGRRRTRHDPSSTQGGDGGGGAFGGRRAGGG